MRRAYLVTGMCFFLPASGCTALATTPGWTGGGMAVTAPERIALMEADLEEQREQLALASATIGAKHILVMHTKSERKPPEVKRTRAEAEKRAQECLAKLRAGAEFDAMVQECSDEPGAASRAGDLGVFGRDQMVKEFGDAAFSLRVGEISDIVETPFGFHIIKRTE